MESKSILHRMCSKENEMPQELIRIDYTFIDVELPSTIHADSVYMRKNDYINYNDIDMVKRIVNVFFDETGGGRILKEIKYVKLLGVRLI